MAWTKAKTAAVLAVGVLLATGTTTVAVKQFTERRTYSWQTRYINTATLNQVPPQVHIVPTKFPQYAGWGMNDERVLGIAQTLKTILFVAYGGTSPYRIVSTTKLSEDKYDFIANLPKNSLQAFQQEIQSKFGLSARHETRQTDVLRLTVKNAGADGLRQSESQGGSSESRAGWFSCRNQPLSCLGSMLENYFQVPVVDDTGLKRRFDIELTWEQSDFQHRNPEALKQALLDDLGLELIPAKAPVDMLVVEQTR